MKGIVLAAGKGSRLAELNLQHKSFAEINKKHVIDYSLDLLTTADNGKSVVNEIIIVVGYHAESIIEYVGDAYRGIPVKYAWQKELKGVAHAVMVGSDLLQDDFVMCLADEILINPQLKRMVDMFYEKNADCVCGVVMDETDFSGKPIAYDVDEATGKITKITEKPKTYENAYRGIGECIFSKKSLSYLKELQPNPIRGELEMGDWIRMIQEDTNNVYVCELADAYANINYAKDIQSAEALLKE